MSQQHTDDKEMYGEFIECNLDDLFEEYYSIKPNDSIDDAYANDKNFHAYCGKEFESHMAGDSDWAYDQAKDQQHN